MCGDAHMDLNSNNRDTKKLKEFLKQHNLSQKINKLTRVTNLTSTLIDHIYVNPELHAHAGTLESGLSYDSPTLSHIGPLVAQ